MSQSTQAEDRSAAIAVAAFPAFILAGSLIAWLFPAPFIPATAYITQFLMIIMFSMGLTLTIPDLSQVVKRPAPIIIGVIAQFVIMPLAAIAVGKILGLNPALAVGLLMLGSVPGGTASNVIAYLAKGDVALSVAMTSVSTLVAPIATPALMLLLAGAETDVDALGMAQSLVKTVLLPVIGGIVLRIVLNRWIDRIAPVLPWVSIAGIGGVVFPTIANNVDNLATMGIIVFVAVMLHNIAGYVLGFLTGRLFKMPEAYCRTMAVEIGTQSAGLSSGMSAQFFSPEAALPGACAAVMHNVNGALYAFAIRRWGREGSVDVAAGESSESAAKPAAVVRRG